MKQETLNEIKDFISKIVNGEINAIEIETIAHELEEKLNENNTK